jgi:hypothetical protein
VDPVPDTLLRKSGRAGNRTQTSVSVARNSDQQTTEAVARGTQANRKYLRQNWLVFRTRFVAVAYRMHVRDVTALTNSIDPFL